MPDQRRIVRDAFACLKIPVFRVAKTRRMTVQKSEICPATMQVCVNIIAWIHLVGLDSGQIFTIEENDHRDRFWDYANSYGMIIGTSAVNHSIEAI